MSLRIGLQSLLYGARRLHRSSPVVRITRIPLFVSFEPRCSHRSNTVVRITRTLAFVQPGEKVRRNCSDIISNSRYFTNMDSILLECLTL